MTPAAIDAEFIAILKRLTKLAMEMRLQAKELRELQEAIAGDQPRPKPQTKTVGNVVLLPGVSLASARRAQRKRRAQS
jgi:hypothetical protein